MQKYYTGIGNRNTPKEYIIKIKAISIRLNKLDYVLRSGGAAGADIAFESGAADKKQIFIPWNNFNGRKLFYRIPEMCFIMAKDLHPAWDFISGGVKAMMARNVMQVLGHDLNNKSNLLICYTRDGAINEDEVTINTGGTGLAIKLAFRNKIPIYNIKNSTCEDKLSDFLTTLEERKFLNG